MSDPDQRRGGLAERRDSLVQAASVTERRAGEPANGAAQHGVRGAARARGKEPSSLVGGGEMGGRIRAHDWAPTPLGPIEQWPACLHNALAMILQSPVPMSINWGESGVLFYNDAMIPLLAGQHPDALGISAMDVWPEHARWTERLLQRVLAGESVSLHNHAMETRRSGMREQNWFNLDYSPILDENGRARGMLGVTVETTAEVAALAERERLDASLRQSEERQRFVLAFNDRVRGLSSPQAVMTEAVTALGEHLQVARCGYAAVHLDMQQLEVEAEWTDSAQASALGVQSMSESSEAVRATFLAGKTFVVRDANNDARETVRARAAKYLAWGARALIGAPLIHNGRWVGLLYVADAKLRAWSPAEIALVEEMAARAWEAIERARAETALRENEARLRGLFEAVPSAVFVCDRNAVIQDYNARAVELWGRSPLRGVDRRGSVRLWLPDGEELPPDFSQLEQVIRTGRAVHGLEMVIGRPDGSRVPVQLDFSPLKDVRGEVTGAITSFHDISGRKRREAELALLADIGEATTRCDSEAQIMQAVSPRIGGYMGLHCCCLISVDEAQQDAVVDQVWYDGAIPDLPRRAPLSDFVIPAFAEEARTGKPIVVNDCYADPRTDGDAYARYEVASYISVPWHENGHWRGLLAFCDDQPRAWNEHEVELARELANRIMPRLQRARAQTALRESQQQLTSQVSDLERLHALGTRLMQQDDMEAVLREAMQAANELLHADKATVQICEQDHLKLVGSVGFPEEFLDRFRVVGADGITTCAAALRARERVMVHDIRDDPRFPELADASLSQNLRGAVSTPLLAEDGSVTAMFTLYFSRPWKGNAHALRMLDLYAQQAAVQIERVRSGRDAAWLAAIVTSSHDAIISKDLGGTITSWNHGAELLFGYTAEEAIGQPVTMLMPPERVGEEPGILARIRAGEIVDHFETVRRCKDGTLLDVLLTIGPIRDAQGRIVGASKIARDITVRKRAQREREASLARERTAREEAEVLVESALLLSSQTDYEDLAQKLTDLAARLTGAQYGAFFHNVVNEDGESYMLYTLSGAERSDFANMPMPTNSPLFKPIFEGRGPMRCGDVRRHPDFGKGEYHGLPPGHLPVTSFLAVPVVSRTGRVYGGLFFAHAERDVFDERAERLVEGIAAQAVIALENAQMYQGIAESEARFREMIDALPMPVYTTDSQGFITQFNPASVEFAGRTPEVGSDAWSVGWKLYRADGSPLPHDQGPMAMALKQDRPIFGGIEVIAELPDGRRRWFTPYPTPLHDEHGHLTGGINMLVDISERKRQEQALADAHSRTESQGRLYQAILDNTPDLAYIFDLDHRFTYANAILLEMWGKSWDEAIGKTCLELGYPEWHAAMHDREIEQVIATRLPVRGQVPFTGIFGERIYDYVFVPVLGHSGEVEAVAGTTRDITDQKETERNLRAEEERKSFLLALTDELRGLRDPDEIQRAVCVALGRRFDCDRVYFTEIHAAERSATILSDFHRGLDSIAGEQDISGMDDFLASLADGKPLVVDDAEQASLPEALQALVKGFGMRAVAGVWLIRHGELVWALAAGSKQRREWKPEEVSLLQEVAERTWDTVQRAKAVHDLSVAREKSEQQARTMDSTLSSVLDMVFRYTPDGRFDFANQALLDLFGLSAEQVIGKSMAELGYDPKTEQTVLRDLARVVESRAPVEGETEYVNPAGIEGYYTYKFAPIFDAEGDVTLIAGTALDISDRKRNEMLLAEQKNVLELVATGCELPHCLEELTASVSRLDEHTRAAVLLASENRRRFEQVHTAHIPHAFAEGIAGAPINELAIGTCGTAVFSGRPVICTDIASDGHWSPEWRELCLANDMRAGYSTPIFDSHGQAIGSFFMAFDRVGEPDAWHRRIAEFGAHVASIAITNHRAEAAVRQSEESLAKELADTRLLQGVSTELLSETDPDALYSRIVDAAKALMRSDAASLQMLHPERGNGGELRLLAHRGFTDEAARRWEWIKIDSETTCGMALGQGKRIIVKDVRGCAATLGDEGVADYERTGIRAVQTTPLFARSGRLVGMLSTHWHEPHEPSPRRLGLLEVLGRQAADLIEGRRAEQKLLELNNFLERRVAERTAELVESERRVRDMASQLTMAEHAERRRISQILHDDLQQQLHSIQMKLASARNALGRGDEVKTLRHLSDAEQWSGEGVETARRLTVDLSPPILKSEGLAEALDWLVTQMRAMHGLHVTVSGDRDLRMHDDAKRVLIYQIVRELLFNIVKHAGTNQARIELRRQEDLLDVCVLDEGRGFDPEQTRKKDRRAAGGFGLTSAHERLNLLGGGIEVDSAPGVGTAIVLHVPLRRSADETEQGPDAQASDTEDLFG